MHKGCTFGGVYVPCIYSHASWSYHTRFRTLLLCPLSDERYHLPLFADSSVYKHISNSFHSSGFFFKHQDNKKTFCTLSMSPHPPAKKVLPGTKPERERNDGVGCGNGERGEKPTCCSEGSHVVICTWGSPWGDRPVGGDPTCPCPAAVAVWPPPTPTPNPPCAGPTVALPLAMVDLAPGWWW